MLEIAITWDEILYPLYTTGLRREVWDAWKEFRERQRMDQAIIESLGYA